jgi:hypothetical protein
VFFFISAISAGLAMTIFESFLSYRAFGKHLEKDILTGLARVIVVVLAVYLVMRFQDLLQNGNFYLAFQVSHESILFWGEIGLGVILPMVLLFIAKVREREGGLFFSALLVVLGFIVNRLNITITGMLHSENYFPKWTEFAVTLSIIALGFAVFGLAVKYFPVFPKGEPTEYKKLSGVRTKNLHHPVFTRRIVMGLWMLVLFGMMIYGLTKNYEENHILSTVDYKPIKRNINLSEVYPDLPENFNFLTSLHFTTKGMKYWYSKENGGLERITEVPYSELGCKNCHVTGCGACHEESDQGKLIYSSIAPTIQSECLKCHGREKAIMKIDREAGEEDVHVAMDMTCTDCHSLEEMHGDGKNYISMKQEGAMDTECENCHDDIEPSSSHLVHNDKLDCKGCHSRHVLSCTNCHFDAMVKTGKRSAIPVSEWLFLINYKGKVTAGNMQNFVAKENKTFLIFAPHMSHSIMKEGRKCEDCHGSENAKNVHNGKVTLTWFEDGKVQNLKGVIPVVKGVDYKCVYQNLEENKWIPIDNPSDPLIQYPAFGKPLSKNQLDQLVKVQKISMHMEK